MWCKLRLCVFRVCTSVRTFFIMVNDMEKTAVFIGHRDCYELTADNIIPAIEKCISMGIDTFLNGGMGHFDNISAIAVDSLRAKYPNIKLVLVKPYPKLKAHNPSLYDDVILFADESYIDEIGYRRAIPQRNEYLVDHSSVAICYVHRQSAGAFKTYLKAKQKGLKIIEIDA